MNELKLAMQKNSDILETALAALLYIEPINLDDDKLNATIKAEATLIDAMRYASLGGGKRLRPFLTMQVAKLFKIPHQAALKTACAIELVHCYSLVHDDLPAMDDDELRRGKPTLHIQFDEATAILAGDALLTLAFEILTDNDIHKDPEIRLRLVKQLAKASGSRGMVGGQMIDLNANGNFDITTISRLQQLKTGCLINFACIAPAIIANTPQHHMDALINYSHNLGLVFQITDDILDIEGSAKEMGKAVGKDGGHDKATFVSILGIDGAKDKANALCGKAIDDLAIFGEKADILCQVCNFVMKRKN